MDAAKNLIWSILNFPLIPVGKTTVTLWMIFYIILLIFLLVLFASQLRKKFFQKVLAKTKLDTSLQYALALCLEYLIVLIGSIIILNTAGIEMTALTVIAGSIGLGLSLGLQSLAKNIAGGIVILLERPLRIGDRIQIGDTIGDVTHIGLRSTVIRTNNLFDVIIPNGEIINSKLINWTLSSQQICISLNITLAHQNKLEQISEIFILVAKNHPSVLNEPAPEIFMENFNEGKFNYTLRFSTNDYLKTEKIKSEINHELFKELVKLNILQI